MPISEFLTRTLNGIGVLEAASVADLAAIGSYPESGSCHEPPGIERESTGTRAASDLYFISSQEFDPIP